MEEKKMNNLEDFLLTARKAAKESGLILLDIFRKMEMEGLGMKLKGRRDPVTEADLASQDSIVRMIKDRHPDHSILAEEAHDPEKPPGKRSGYVWIIDPLDGTVNFLHGIPVFAVSIALEFDGDIIAGVVYQPVTGELYHAVAGCGAHLNDRLIKVSSTAELGKAVLATGFPYIRNETEKNNLDHFCNFFLNVRGLRRMGVASLDLAFVAAGRFDGHWELHLNPWDVAAGSLLIKEAGGMVTDFDGTGDYIYSGRIVTSNSRVHREMLDVLAKGKY